MKKVLFCLILLNFLIAASSTFAEDIVEKTFESGFLQNRIGVSGSTISGYGLTYQRFISPDMALKLLGFFYLNQKSNDKDYNEVYSVGIELKPTISTWKVITVYGILGAGYWGYDYSTPAETYKEATIERFGSYNLGLGLGLEILAGRRIGFNFDLGFKYQIYKEIPYKSYTTVMPDYQDGRYFGFAFGAGITYAF
ncbi:MAG: hypothetical protein QG635_2505 [Bacteroidota bacterium]|nr:hypothetical protein [Bacteroidota bacterium]